MVSCPVTTADGQVFSMIQADVSGNKTESYAISAAFAKDLSINVLSLNNAALKSIGIKKALPDTEEQALVYLLMSASTMDSSNILIVRKVIHAVQTITFTISRMNSISL